MPESREVDALIEYFPKRRIPVFINFMIKAFSSQIAYRFEYFMGVLNGLLFIFIFTSVWNTVYSTSPSNPFTAIFSKEQIINYAVFAMIIRISMSIESDRIGGRVRSGYIVIELMRPVNYFLTHLSEGFGEAVYNWFSRIIPILTVTILLFDLKFPTSLVTYLLTTVAWICGFLILFMVEFAFSLLAFWFIETFSFHMLKFGLSTLLAGAVIPVDLFPDWTRPYISILPFQYIYYTPTAIFVERLHGAAALEIIALQLAWVVVMGLICRLMWSAAIRRLVIQGG